MKKTAIVLIFIFGIGYCQFIFDLSKPQRSEIFELFPPASMVRIAGLGLDSALAGYYWIKTIQNVYAHDTGGDSILAQYIGLVNDLDPRFSYPYAFGALVLGQNYPREAVAIGERGVAQADHDWRISYYLATTYHIFLDDRINGAKYLDIAANIVGAPENLKKVAATYSSSLDSRAQTKEIWLSILENSEDNYIKERAEKYIINIETLDFLEEAIRIYRQKTGRYPLALDDLVVEKIIKGIPPNPFGLSYEVSQLDGRARVK